MSFTIRFSPSDGSVWSVPAEVVADNRARHYALRDSQDETYDPRLLYEDVYTQEYAYTLSDDDELLDWAANNMNWEDVRAHAYRIQEPPPPEVDLAKEWTNMDRWVDRSDA
jgi:hypothetical protein